jgi:hypothetical protein
VASRPIEVAVLNCCVTETKETPRRSNVSIILAKSNSERHDADILGHCRSGDEHFRGCWVIDLLLGKS